MKLQVTLALLSMTFCFITGVKTTTAIASCYVNAGTFISTDKGHIKACGNYAKSCVAYIDKYTNEFVRDCSNFTKETACTSIAEAKENTCYSCDSAENCNDKPFKLNCYSNTGYSRSEFGYPITCLSGTCIMYKDINKKYIRTCATTDGDCKALTAEGATLCAECNSEKCNNVAFPTVCNEYRGRNATQLGTPNLCQSGSCIMYKDNNNSYIRSCTTTEGDCKTLNAKGVTFCTQCKSDNCNKDAFPPAIWCNEYRGRNETQLGTPKLCQSGTCIMYKDVDFTNIRGCTETEGVCSALYSVGASSCSECQSNLCNRKALVKAILCFEGSTFEAHKVQGALLQCRSGKCIMYKDTKSGKYVRSCANDEKNCLAIKETATQCSECTTDICNDLRFNTGPNVGLRSLSQAP